MNSTQARMLGLNLEQELMNGQEQSRPVTKDNGNNFELLRTENDEKDDEVSSNLDMKLDNSVTNLP